MKNKELKDLLKKVDTMNLEEIELLKKELQPEVTEMEAAKKKVEEAQKKAQEEKTKASSMSKKEITAIKGITSFRYGAMNLYAELGLTHDKEYSKEELIKLLNSHGYFEFDSKTTDFAQHEKDGTVVITIKGNSKGIEKISIDMLNDAQLIFKKEYETRKTEARVLIYFDPISKAYQLLQPEQENTSVSTTIDLEFNIKIGNVDYFLIFDLHSHHKMGAFFSRQDDANERFRNIVYGVFSWAGNEDIWKFRIFDGKNFNDLNIKDIIK